MRRLIPILWACGLMLGALGVQAQTDGGAYRALGYAYLSPEPGSQYCPARTCFVLMRFATLPPAAVTNLAQCIRVTGASSGFHPGTTKIASDNKTVIFQTPSAFNQNELVTVSLAPQVNTSTNTAIPPYQYQFMISGPMPGGAAITAGGSSTNATPAMAFDDNPLTEWQDPTVPNGSANFAWIQYVYPGGAMHVVNRYAITSANDNPAGDPGGWQFYGVNASGSLFLLDTQTGQTFGNRLQPRSYAFTNTTAYCGYRLVITSVNNPAAASAVQLAELELVPATGSALWECWLDIAGNAVTNLTGNPAYPDSPSLSDQLPCFQGPVNWAANYGTRVRGFITAPLTGSYVFWISSDDNSQLWLSTNADPANASQIASVPSWTDAQVWNLYASQQSAPVNLQAGQRYYIEALHKQGGDGNNLAVGWAMPGQPPSAPSELIPGEVLSPWSNGTPGIPAIVALGSSAPAAKSQSNLARTSSATAAATPSMATNSPNPPPRVATPMVTSLGVTPGQDGIMPNGVSVPTDFPYINITTSNNPDPEYIFIDNRGGNGDPWNVIFDNSGQPVWYSKYPDERRDMKVQHNGVMTLLARDQGGDHFNGFNTNYQQIVQYWTTNGFSGDEHELQVLADGTYFTTALNTQTVDMSRYIEGGVTNASIIESAIQEFTAAGDLIFQWRAWDHVNILDEQQFINLTSQNFDFNHMNAIDADTDGNILLSSRNTSECTKIDRNTGLIIWRLGGVRSDFTFPNDPLNGPANQHAIRMVTTNDYTLFDDGNLHNPSVSRGVEYRVDTNSMTATLVWQYPPIPTPSLYSYYMGNTQRLTNGNTLIDWAVGGLPKLTEVRPDGTKAFEMNWVNQYEAYRTWRCSWPGVAVQPYLLLESYPDNVTLIFNQFGDTNIAYYRIYGGTASQSTNLLATSTTTLARLTYLQNGSTYFFRVTAVHRDGTEGPYSNEQSVTVNLIQPGRNMLVNGSFSPLALGLQARVASDTSGGNIQVCLGAANGPLIGLLTVTNTGGWQTWQTMSTVLTNTIGIQDLVLLFEGGSGYLLNLEWLRVTSIPTNIPAADFSSQSGGIRLENCSEGGQDASFINSGSWLDYSGLDFDNSTNLAAGAYGWTLSLANSGAASWSVANQVASFSIANGGAYATDIQWQQTGLRMIQGVQYILSFDAWAAQPRYIQAEVGQAASPYLNYSGIGATPLTPVPTPFQYTFTMQQTSDFNASLLFDLGTSAAGVSLSNVSLCIAPPTTATSLTWVQSPSTIVAGSVISPEIQVGASNEAYAVAGLPVTLLLSSGGGVLTGLQTANTDANGIAHFSNLSVSQAGLKQIVAGNSSLVITSAVFNVLPPPLTATALSWARQPSSAAAGAVISPEIQVAAWSNAAPVSNVLLTLSLTNGAGTLAGIQATNTDARGIAHFPNLSLNAAGLKQLAAGDATTTLVTNSAPFTISPLAANKLVIAQQPPATAAAGAVMTPALAIQVTDQYGNVISNDTDTVSALQTPGTGGHLNASAASQTAAASNGTAVFPSLFVTNAAGNVTLMFTDSKLPNPTVTSSAITVSAAAATALKMTRQPSSAATTGAAFLQQPGVTVLDNYGNVATSYANAVLAAETAGGNLNGTLAAPAVIPVSGVALFSGLFVTNSGPAIALKFTSGGLTPASSTAINVSAGPASELLWIVQPGNATNGLPFGTQPVLQSADSFGNPSTGGLAAIQNVQAYLSAGTGPLLGATNFNIGSSGGNGVAVFTNLQINAPGAGCVLTATNVTSAGFIPPQQNQLGLWLDASDLNSLTLLAGDVTAWNDRSGNGRNAIAGIFPVLATNSALASGASGQARTVRFDGASTFFDVDLTFLNNTPYTVAVLEVASNKSGNTSYFMGDTGSGGNSQDKALHTGYRDSGDFAFAQYADDLDYTPGSFAYPAARVWMDTIDSNLNRTIYLNGASVVAGTAAGFLNAAGCQGHIGSGFDTSSTCFQGDVAEILVYSNCLSAAASIQVFDYFSNKWLCAGCATPGLLASAVSAPFTVRAPAPPAQKILGVVLAGGGSVVLTYATTAGYQYQVQFTTNLAPASWTTLPASVTNAAGASVIFTDTNSPRGIQRFYRIVSP